MWAVREDLVVTADIPLAAEVIAKGGEALNPRGELYSPDTIRGVLAMRDFMDTMRSSGNVGGGPPPLTQANRNAFAGHLDTRWRSGRPSNGARIRTTPAGSENTVHKPSYPIT